MTKFKIGDKVRVRKDLNGGSRYDGLHFAYDMEKYRGKDTAILEVRDSNRYYLEIAGSEWVFNDDMLENIQTIKSINDLSFGDILTLRNSERYVYVAGKMYGEGCRCYCHCDCIADNYRDDLARKSGLSEYDIVKIERKGEVIYEREEILEVTMKEVCEKFGQEVKIVKENE